MNSAISIITVVRNDLEGLKTTAKSILSQDCRNYDWIIIDGYSSDGSYEYAKELTAYDFVTIDQTSPRGIYNAMNHGAQKSNAPWIWFVNAGDVFLSESILKKIEKLLKQSNSASIIASPVVYLTPSQSVFSISLPRVVEEDSKQYALFHHQGSIMSRSIFFQAGAFDEEFDFAADGKLLDSMLAISKPVIVPLVTVGFEMGGASSQNFRRSLKEIRKYRNAILPTNKVIIYQLKEVIRHLILRGCNYALVLYFITPYLNSRERSVLRKARLFGAEFVEKTNGR